MAINEQKLMQRCLELARRGAGWTSPNPMVGALVVKDGEIVGEGFHPGVGQPHAEIFALREAGEKAQGATVYVSLEPCNHYGRTPPCSEALIAVGVKKVVVGMVDPDPRVSGGGIERLRTAGIEVVVGVEEAACRELNEAFIHRVVNKRPFGILKYAMTLDGKIAATTGHSSWITSEKSRHRVHLERAASDVVIVGGSTLRQDNPLLTSHGVHEHNPLRVVMSRSLDLPADARLWNTETVPTLVLTEVGANRNLQSLLRDKGVEVRELSPLTPDTVMEYFYKREFSRIFWECGGTLAARAIADGAVQKVMAFIAPKIIGGKDAPSPVGDLGLTQMTQALGLARVKFSQIDRDFLVEGYLEIK